MSEAKYKRDKKKQMGQFMTPRSLVNKLLNNRSYKTTDKVLEPSFGVGSFLIEIVHKFINVYPENLSLKEKLDFIFSNNIYGVEMDTELYDLAIKNIEKEFNYNLSHHNLINDDFFNVNYNIEFNYVEGNPPFGGTFEVKFGDKLDKIYGFRDGLKIKKETYSFFTIKCLELLSHGGLLGFICSDTFLTINTMKGLRIVLSKYDIKVNQISFFSEETNYGMVYFELEKVENSSIIINGIALTKTDLMLSENFSFKMGNEFSKYFKGVTLKKYLTCSSGMTTGKNEYFLKDKIGEFITENYEYIITEEPKSLLKETYRSKTGEISKEKNNDINNGVIEKVITIKEKNTPEIIRLPDNRYLPYNKSVSEKIYSEPKTYIIWDNDGEAVITYKKTGRWYLHGVGGKPFFKREGLTWSLISDDIKVRYLPEGYILDSGCPVGVLKNDIDRNELYFIIGWLLSPITTKILKNVINHTKNIQSKDIERLPYPNWVNDENKNMVIEMVKKLISNKINGVDINNDYEIMLENIFTIKN